MRCLEDDLANETYIGENNQKIFFLNQRKSRQRPKNCFSLELFSLKDPDLRDQFSIQQKARLLVEKVALEQ